MADNTAQANTPSRPSDVMQMWVNMMRFWAEVLKPYEPEGWKLKNTIVCENPSLWLRNFTPDLHNSRTPVLILAPNAGHHQNIAEPLIGKTLTVDSSRPVFLLEWKEPTTTSKNKSDSIDDIVTNIHACVDQIGGKVHLFCLCQGAWAGAIYGALYPYTLASYTNAAGPIDFEAGDGKIENGCRVLPMAFFEGLVAAGGGVQKGESQLMGFKGMNPYDRYVGDYVDLWEAVCKGDEKEIKKWHRFKEWYEQPVDIPGVWYLEAVDKLFKHNLLIKGELVILGQKVDLSKITCPVHLIAGDEDDVTLPEQVFAMAKVVTGPVTMKTLENAGHIGVFVKESSLKYWETDILKSLD